MGPNLVPRFKGVGPLPKLRNEHKDSFAFVIEMHAVEIASVVTMDFREFDVLVESLGNLKSCINIIKILDLKKSINLSYFHSFDRLYKC